MFDFIIFQKDSAVKSLLIKNAFKSRFTHVMFTSCVDFGIFCDQKNIAGGNSILLWDLRSTWGPNFDGEIVVWIISASVLHPYRCH